MTCHARHTHTFARGAVTALLATLVCAGAPSQAATLTVAPAVRLTCDDFENTTIGIVTPDRDTTGTGRETVMHEIRDGAGTVVFSGSISQVLGTDVWVNFGTNLYTTAPTTNPLTYRLISPAGNGLPEQVLFTTVGNCASLPTAAAVPTLEFWGLGLLAVAAAGMGAGQLRRRQRAR